MKSKKSNVFVASEMRSLLDRFAGPMFNANGIFSRDKSPKIICGKNLEQMVQNCKMAKLKWSKIGAKSKAIASGFLSLPGAASAATKKEVASGDDFRFAVVGLSHNIQPTSTSYFVLNRLERLPGLVIFFR